MGSRQLSLVFADSPSGGGGVRAVGVPTGKAFLLHIAKTSSPHGPTAAADASECLLEEVTSPLNLATALLHVARNKGAAGVDGKSTREVVADAHWVLPKLSEALLSGNYSPGDVKRVWIPKPGGGQRGLGIPNVVDRWVQQAVHQVLMPIFEPDFHQSSHGFRPARGAQTAVAEAKEHLRAGHTWVVGVDLSKFFDWVDHQRLLARLSHRVKDGRVLRLVHRMLKADVVLPNGQRTKTERGTPQGGPLSPLLSNIVLDELDRELGRRGLRFVRYADDFNIYVRSQRAGQRIMAAVTRFTEGRLRLKVNVDKSLVARSQQVHFLGFRLRLRADRRVAVHLSARSRKRLDTRVRELTPRSWGQPLETCIEQINGYLKGWSGYFRLCTEDEQWVLKRYDAHIRRRLRAIVVVQRKRPRYLFRHLVKRGASRKVAARAAWRSCGVWKKSNLPGLTHAYPNRWFAKRMTSLQEARNQANPKASASGQGLLPGLEISA